MDEVRGIIDGLAGLGGPALGTALLAVIAVIGVMKRKIRLALTLCTVAAAVMAWGGTISWLNPAGFLATTVLITGWPLIKRGIGKVTAGDGEPISEE